MTEEQVIMAKTCTVSITNGEQTRKRKSANGKSEGGLGRIYR